MKSICIALVFIVCMALQAQETPFIPQPYILLGDSVLPNDKHYYKYDDIAHDIQLLFPKEHVEVAQHALLVEDKIVPEYAKLYQWKFDETLHVGLISTHSQVANGFSTQWPTNRQINYIGGVGMIDYFCSSSWLDTLLYHETSHNYQINIKDSFVSQLLHTIFGNGMTFGLWTMPNLTINPFMLEGNAVLNESWHGNGGRLYSGRFYAENILQAEAGNITPAKLYNQRLAFPYGEIRYIQGGFYNYFLAKKYGLQKANSFFRNHSHYWFWPFLTNHTMTMTIGVNFENSIKNFSQEYKKLAKNFIKTKGVEVTSSQFFYPLNKQDGKIVFLTNSNAISMPELCLINTKSLHVRKIRGSWLGGKIFLLHGKYYSASTNHTSPTHITQGLFDENGLLKEGSASQVVQTFLTNGTKVYFDINSSFISPQLYVGSNYYAQVNSSVINDNQNNLYYFVQKGKTRTLYKNKMPLFNYKGFYGIVSDVDEKGNVYFIGSSKYGSTLYCYNNKVMTRVLFSDDVIDAKLLPNNKIFVVTIGKDAYHYIITDRKRVNEQPYEVKLFFEKQSYYKKHLYTKKASCKKVDTSKEYIPFFEMHYNGTEVDFGTLNGTNYGMINIKFADSLSQNAWQTFYQRDTLGIGIVGAGYANTQYLLNYTLQIYKTIEKNQKYKTNDLGLVLGTSIPLYQAGYLYSTLDVSYFEDYVANMRKPLSIVLSGSLRKHYGISMFDNYKNSLQLYNVLDRDTNIFGIKYSFFHDITDGWYGGLSTHYSLSNNKSFGEAEGVKLSSSLDFEDIYDPSVITMPNFNAITYFKEAGYVDISIYKTINFSKYYFSFPLSVQREALYSKYKYYTFKDFYANRYHANEFTLGLRIDSILANDFVLPIQFEYIYNDGNFVKNKNNFRFFINSSFF